MREEGRVFERTIFMRGGDDEKKENFAEQNRMLESSTTTDSGTEIKRSRFIGRSVK